MTKGQKSLRAMHIAEAGQAIHDAHQVLEAETLSDEVHQTYNHFLDVARHMTYLATRLGGRLSADELAYINEEVDKWG
jgi:hypothetical protein